MGLQVLRSSRRMVRMAVVCSVPAAIRASTRFLKLVNASATAVLSTSMAAAQLAEEPTALNSKRLPVKANGLVRLRSVLSMLISGISGISSFRVWRPLMAPKSVGVAFSIFSRISEICLPKKDEMMAGGASLAPKRCWLVAVMIEAFNKPLWR